MTVAQEVSLNSLAKISFRDVKLSRPVAAVYKKTKVLSPALEQFLSFWPENRLLGQADCGRIACQAAVNKCYYFATFAGNRCLFFFICDARNGTDIHEQILADADGFSGEFKEWTKEWRTAAENGSEEPLLGFFAREKGLTEETFLERLAEAMELRFVEPAELNPSNEARKR